MSAGPRVLLVSPEYPPLPGGIGDYTALLARHLRLHHATVAVLTSGSDGDASDACNEYGVRILRAVPHWGWGLTGRIRNAMRRTGAEVVHIQYQTGMYAMHPAVNLLPWRLSSHAPVRRRAFPSRVRAVTTFHDLRPPYLFPKAGPLRNGVTRLLARASDAAIVTNGVDAALLRRWGMQPTLVPIGSNIPATMNPAPSPETQRHFREQYGIAPDAVLLTTFGLLNASKGLDTAIDALALVRDGGIAAHLLLVGAGVGANDPTNRATDAALTARIAARGLMPYVTRTGPLTSNAVADALAWGQACLLPYRDGASPRRGSLLAALTQGVPVVTTAPERGAYDGLPPLTEEAVAFALPNDAMTIAAAVRRILADESYATRLRTGARAYAARFSWDAIARRTLAAYADGADSADSGSDVEMRTSSL